MSAEMVQRKRSFVPGLILLCIGTYLLLRELDLWDFGWLEIYPLILLGIGLLYFRNFIADRAHGPLIWSVFFLGNGTFFLLRNYGILPFWPIDVAWPIIPLVLAAGYLAAFVYLEAKPGLFLGFAIAGFIGVVGLADSFGAINLPDINRLWPVLLILLGILIILKGYRSTQSSS